MCTLVLTPVAKYLVISVSCFHDVVPDCWPRKRHNDEHRVRGHGFLRASAEGGRRTGSSHRINACATGVLACLGISKRSIRKAFVFVPSSGDEAVGATSP